MTGNFFKIGSQVADVANWNLDQISIRQSRFPRRSPCQHLFNFSCQPFENRFNGRAAFHCANGIVEYRDGRIGRREFDGTRNSGGLQMLLCVENIGECLVRTRLGIGTQIE